LHLDAKSRAGKISRTSESSRMRFVMKQFDVYKKNFHATSPSKKIDLPEPIHKISIPGKVKDGELTITKYDLQPDYNNVMQLISCSAEMRSFFDPCVDGVIDLIQGQLHQIEKRGRRLKVHNLFLLILFLNSTNYVERISYRWLRRI